MYPLSVRLRLNKKAKILILDEPTKGVDVGAKLEIHKLINNLSIRGTSILVISSEIEEILNLSDRVIVLREGKIIGELVHDQINNLKLMEMSLGKG